MSGRTVDEILEEEARTSFCYGVGTEDASLLADEIRRLRADNEAMKAAFSDACLDKEPLRLAREEGQEEGRAEALEWWAKTRRPARPADLSDGFFFSREEEGWTVKEHHLPDSVFDLLEGGIQGSPGPHGGTGAKHYRSWGEAMAALFAACRKRAREPMEEKR